MFVIMIRLRGQRWFVRKSIGQRSAKINGGRIIWTQTTNVAAAHFFTKLDSADRIVKKFDRKYPATEVCRIVHDGSEFALFTLHGDKIEDITDGQRDTVPPASEGGSS